MFSYRKNKLKHAVMIADKAKKVNPLDLSADQDLTIAVMNLIKLEKLLDGTCMSGGCDMAGAVYDMRCNLMGRIVLDIKSDLWDMSVQLLGNAMDLLDSGLQQIGIDDKSAYELFNRSYEFYSMFWGVNMGMIAVSDVVQDIGK